jgi:hypothetical protein
MGWVLRRGARPGYGAPWCRNSTLLLFFAGPSSALSLSLSRSLSLPPPALVGMNASPSPPMLAAGVSGTSKEDADLFRVPVPLNPVEVEPDPEGPGRSLIDTAGDGA